MGRVPEQPLRAWAKFGDGAIMATPSAAAGSNRTWMTTATYSNEMPAREPMTPKYVSAKPINISLSWVLSQHDSPGQGPRSETSPASSTDRRKSVTVSSAFLVSTPEPFSWATNCYWFLTRSALLRRTIQAFLAGCPRLERYQDAMALNSANSAGSSAQGWVATQFGHYQYRK
jgi:hypothetical protein